MKLELNFSYFQSFFKFDDSQKGRQAPSLRTADVMVSWEKGQWFCDDSTQALVLKKRVEGGWELKQWVT